VMSSIFLLLHVCCSVASFLNKLETSSVSEPISVEIEKPLDKVNDSIW
jgi:hypothetical protein